MRQNGGALVHLPSPSVHSASPHALSFPRPTDDVRRATRAARGTDARQIEAAAAGQRRAEATVLLGRLAGRIGEEQHRLTLTALRCSARLIPKEVERRREGHQRLQRQKEKSRGAAAGSSGDVVKHVLAGAAGVGSQRLHRPLAGLRHLPQQGLLRGPPPGWICYAEKTLGSYILPYISSVKSPQQVIGAAIKHHMVEKLGFKPYDVYHVTVMPCYDKKLEAVRDDFVFSVEEKEITEVDSVLTTGEVLDLIQSKSIDFKTMEESPLDSLLTNVDEDGHLYGVSGGSGGYAETIFRYAARALFNREREGSLDCRNHLSLCSTCTLQ